MPIYENLISPGQGHGVFFFLIDTFCSADVLLLLASLGWPYPCHVSQNCDVFLCQKPNKNLPMQRTFGTRGLCHNTAVENMVVLTYIYLHILAVQNKAYRTSIL